MALLWPNGVQHDDVLLFVSDAAPYVVKNEAPEVMLPPESIITRWGTWLDATDYYCKHIQSIRNVFMKLDDDTASILKVKNFLDDQQLDANLVRITANFGIISKSITQLEKRGLKIVDSINILNKIIDDITIIDTQSKSIKSVVEKLKKNIRKKQRFQYASYNFKYFKWHGGKH